MADIVLPISPLTKDALKQSFFSIQPYPTDDISKIRLIFQKAFTDQISDQVYQDYFNDVWDKTLKDFEKTPSKNKNLNRPFKLIRSLFQQNIEKSFVHLGQGQLSHNPEEYLYADNDSSLTDQEKTVEEIVQFLLGRTQDEITDLCPSKPGDNRTWLGTEGLKKCVLWNKDPQSLKLMKKAFQEALDYCADQMEVMNQNIGSGKEKIFEGLIGNIVALLPYAYPEENEEYFIPQKINNEWQRIPYRLDKRIEFWETGHWMFSPIVAFGLVPADQENHSEYPPLLTFLGTTYPGGDGFMSTLFSDFTGSVGEVAFWNHGKEKIQEWLYNRRVPNDGSLIPSRLFGMSLGGAFCFHALRAFTENMTDASQKVIEAIYAYSPPGLYDAFHDNWWRNIPHQTQFLPDIRIYIQKGDLVSNMGYFPELPHTTVMRIYPQNSYYEKSNLLIAHACVYTGLKDLLAVEYKPSQINQETCRKVMTFFHRVLKYPFVCPGLLIMWIFGLIFNCFSLLLEWIKGFCAKQEEAKDQVPLNHALNEA
jgi:hypothetical protein